MDIPVVFLGIAGYMAFVGTMVAVIGRSRPTWRNVRVVLATSLPIPASLVAVGMCAALYTLSQPDTPYDRQAGETAASAALWILKGFSGVALVMFAVSLAVALAVLFIVKNRN